MAKDKELIEVEIRNFEAYKGRKDVEHNSWFRCSNRLLEDPDFFDFSLQEITVWVYILSLSSQKNAAKFTINARHAQQVARISIELLNSAIRKLSKINVLTATALRGRYADVTKTCATDITDRHNRQDITYISADHVRDLWVSQVPSLPKIQEVDNARLQRVRGFLKNRSEEDLVAFFDRIEKSDFLCGRSGNDFRASFDWVFKPANTKKILEGNYDNRDTRAQKESWDHLLLKDDKVTA